jgi:hypothetical protein
MRFRRAGTPMLTNWQGSTVELLPCVEAPIDLVMAMDGLTGQQQG